ncbi:MAG: 1,4-dihydroxy-2-naphthoate octaprenyltransferase [Dehalococcoidales bacterium]|nr:1,4-dihydroxy-2-naphthoate octaprenyltransferase [Dehalococcoidales bacterium]
MEHTRQEIQSVMDKVEVAVVASSAGDKLRQRMMHYAFNEDCEIYLATMKGDPKTIQMVNHPSVALLISFPGANINESREIEITGKAVFVRDQAERDKALEMTAKRSPVVKYMTGSGNAGQLDCIKVVPDTLKFRVFSEIVQGQPPTVIEFPRSHETVSDWHLAGMKLKSWITAIRVPFLTASAVPILLGTMIAWFTSGVFRWEFFLLTLIAGLAIHTGANIINDYSDHNSGNDEANHEYVRPFSGGSRVIQLGLLTPLEVLSGALFCFFLSAVIGLYLAWTRGPFLIVLGLVGLLSGLFYTGGPFNWAKRGFGELLVGLNFGILMTVGAYYVQAQTLSWLPVIAAISVSLLIAAVLYINEFPDYAADKHVGKNTLVVRMGRQRAVIIYALIMALAYLSIVIGVIARVLPLTALIGLMTLPLAVRAVYYARKYNASSFDLIPANALTVTSHLATGLLLTLAFAWQSFGADGLAYVVVMGIIFTGFVVYMYRHIEKQKNIFLGLKQALR